MSEISLELANKLFSISNVVLVIGAFLVLAGTWGAIQMGAIKERYGNERISKNEAQTAQANAEAAKANQRAAEAQESAERERLSRVKIEERLAPRSLNEKQILTIADNLRNFAPQKFEFIAYQDDAEVQMLATMIAKALFAAGWEAKQATGFLAFQLEFGVTMELSTENADKFRTAAVALADALNEEGIVAKVHVEPKITDPQDAIRIRVGKKP